MVLVIETVEKMYQYRTLHSAGGAEVRGFWAKGVPVAQWDSNPLAPGIEQGKAYIRMGH